jgi:hypothetical protein
MHMHVCAGWYGGRGHAYDLAVFANSLTCCDVTAGDFVAQGNVLPDQQRLFQALDMGLLACAQGAQGRGHVVSLV